jgi:hypothetical protein
MSADRPASLAFMDSERPDHVVPDLVTTRRLQWYADELATTNELIAQWSTQVAAHLDEEYCRTVKGSEDQLAGFDALCASLGVEVTAVEPEPEDDVQFAWESVAGACVLAHLDLLADAEEHDIAVDVLAKMTSERINAGRFERATGIPPVDQPTILHWAADAMFGESGGSHVLYRDRYMDLRWESYSVQVEREIPPHSDQQRASEREPALTQEPVFA